MTKENNNPFNELKKPSRGKGLQSPPNKKTTGNNTNLKENTPAVPVKQARTYRVSTLINEIAGDKLEQFIYDTRKKTGKKPKIAEVLEMAIDKL